MSAGLMPILGTALLLRMDVLNEEWAQRNHGQRLARLAERGGLSPSEAAAIMQRRRWQRMSQEDALRVIAEKRPGR